MPTPPPWCTDTQVAPEAVFKSAAVRAGDWLANIADEQGRWTRSTYNGIPHVYNTRTAWALLELAALEKNSDYERVARANLDQLSCVVHHLDDERVVAAALHAEVWASDR